MPDAHAEVFLKLENLQPVGAFKTRGATYAMRKAPLQELRKGVVTASAGNMAQAVAWSARELGIRCTVIAPETAPAVKLDAVRRLGADVIVTTFERWWQALADRGYAGLDGMFIHPFDDPFVMAGNGTIGLEILDDLADVDTVLVPWGGGGLSIGIAAAIKAIRPSCDVFAVEVDTAAPLAAAFDSGHPVEVDYRASFVDGIGSRTVMPTMFALAREFLAASLVTNLSAVAGAIRILAQQHHVVAEGAGAAPVAVALSGQTAGRRVACVVSGGNIDVSKLVKILQGDMP